MTDRGSYLATSDDVEKSLALGILGGKSEESARVLFRMLGEPRRPVELEGVMGGKGRNNLTVILQGLERDGLVTRRVLPPGGNRNVFYALTPLGVATALKIHVFEALGKIVSAAPQAVVLHTRSTTSAQSPPGLVLHGGGGGKSARFAKYGGKSKKFNRNAFSGSLWKHIGVKPQPYPFERIHAIGDRVFVGSTVVNLHIENEIKSVNRATGVRVK